MTGNKVLKRFEVTFEGETLSFRVEYDNVLARYVVNGPREALDREAALRARKAAVELARSSGFLDSGMACASSPPSAGSSGVPR